jgi:hypothetical protein
MAKPLDQDKILEKLENNELLWSYWRKCLLIRLKHKKYAILDYIINCGAECYLSTRDADFIFGMNKDTFTKHRDDLVEMNLITLVSIGNAKGHASVYRKNNKGICWAIIEGNLIIQEIKLDLHTKSSKKTIPSQKRDVQNQILTKSTVRKEGTVSKSTVRKEGTVTVRKEGTVLSENKVHNVLNGKEEINKGEDRTSKNDQGLALLDRAGHDLTEPEDIQPLKFTSVKNAKFNINN